MIPTPSATSGQIIIPITQNASSRQGVVAIAIAAVLLVFVYAYVKRGKR